MNIPMTLRLGRALVALSWLAAPCAHALSGLVIESKTTDLSTDHTLGLTVPCPRGKQVLSGGAEINSYSTGTRIIALEPDTEGGAWFRAEAAQEEPGFPGDVTWSLTVHAICADPPPSGLTYKRVITKARSESAAAIRPYCDPGEKLAGFGGRVASAAKPRNVAMVAVLPDADLTNVLVQGLEMEGGEAEDWSVTAYLVCTRDHADLVSALGFSGAPSSIVIKTSTSVCPSGKSLHAIGAAVYSGSGQVSIYDIFPQGLLSGVAFASEDLNGTALGWNIGTAAICG